MYNKKEMKKIRFEKIFSYIMKGEPVYMVMLDGSLVELAENPDMELLMFHTLRGGCFAVYRKKLTGIGAFGKTIRIGRWSFSINHDEKEDIYDFDEEY